MRDRPLIFGTSYVPTRERLRVVELWAKVTRKLNPDCDIILIDSASPVNLKEVCDATGIEYWSFPDNIGHLNLTGKDGWGRAFCKGVEVAIERGYEYFVNLDSDLIFCKPCLPIIERMRCDGVKAAAPMDHVYLFLETAVSFYQTAYMQESRFIESYNWEKGPTDAAPERQLEVLFSDRLWCLPLRGYRNDHWEVTHATIRTNFPYGLDYLTHVSDFSLYNRLLQMNGIEV
jgi:hypothetical protein